MTVRESSEAVHTVEFRNISKYFPGVKALDNVSFSATSHFVYAIVGENGAGKSTLLKILNGDYSMDSGEILFDGVPQRFSSPRDAIDAGVSIIYQEPQLVPEMTVAENIFLGSWPVTDSKLVDFPKMVRDTQEVIDEFGLDIDPRVKVRNLSVAHQQMVEIMKAYARRAKIIAFDEPTSSLTDREIDVLFSIIGKLKAQGKIIFYVSHRMNEIEKIADKSVVLKDGQLVKVVNQNEVTIRELVSLMVGRDLGDVFNSLDRNTKLGEVVLEVEGLSNYYVKDVSFKLRRGEILGFYGLVGAGRTEIMRSIYGLDQVRAGRIVLKGKQVFNRSPAEALRNRIALCSEDRKEQGIIPNLSVGHNISVSVLDRLVDRFRFINAKEEQRMVNAAVKHFNIVTSDPRQKIVELSGGNQQKTMLARGYEVDPDVFILDEPTKGIDVGSKAEVYQMICDLAKDGKSVIFISSELPEIIGISDRIIVMKDGRITGEFTREEASEELLLEYAILVRGTRE